MLTPIAFLQTGPDAIACVEGRLDPAVSPRAGAPAFFAPDFALSAGGRWWLNVTADGPRTLTRTEWASRFPAPASTPAVPRWQQPDEPRFAGAFQSLRACLDAGALRKGVPVTSMSAPLSNDQAVTLFAQLLARVPALPPGLLAYGVFLPQGVIAQQGPEFLVGATPEVLFDLEGSRELVTAAVAGTRSARHAGALTGSLKDRDEHQAVVDDLLAQLSGWGNARASATEVRRFGQLAHLVAGIRLHSRAALDFEAVARRLHPTPALGVYPRGARGADWLAAIDPRGERRRFGAPFGLREGNGAGRCVVAIRNLQYAEGRLEIWAGCGVVSLSRYEDEWQEVLQKMRAVRALWGV
jgi:menaquinone-specific isochorismate synthase